MCSVSCLSVGKEEKGALLTSKFFSNRGSPMKPFSSKFAKLFPVFGVIAQSSYFI